MNPKTCDRLLEAYLTSGEVEFETMAARLKEIGKRFRAATQVEKITKAVLREAKKIRAPARKQGKRADSSGVQSIYRENQNGTVCMYRGTADDGTDLWEKLANFQVTPCCQLTVDNGSGTPEHRFEFTGVLEGGRTLSKVSVPASNYEGLGWIREAWGLEPTIAVGNTKKQHYAAYIQEKAGQSERRTVYAHTGFREIDGTLCYLYHGGAVGADGVECELPEALHGYQVKGCEIGEREAVQEVLRLLEFCPSELGIPMLGAVYLAPLRYFLTGITPAFALFLRGGTNTGKTTTAQLFLSHFYDYQGMTTPPPASFRSTANALERLAFTLKDCLLLVDDYYPTDERDKRRMDDIAQKLARGAGDSASRLRMQSDTSMRKSYPPKCLAVLTGEDLPNIGQSGVARFWVVDLTERLTAPERRAELTALQEQAEKGVFQRAMRGYLQWLIRNAEGLEDTLRAQYREFIGTVKQGSHSRFTANEAHLLLGVQMFAAYAVQVGALSGEEELCSRALETLNRQTMEQEALGHEEQPVKLFLDALRELLETKAAYLLPEHAPNEMDSPISCGALIGYQGEEFVYLIPNATMNAVREFYRGSNHNFTATMKKIKEELDAQGMLHYTQSTARTKTLNKKFCGKQRQYIALRREALDGETL